MNAEAPFSLRIEGDSELVAYIPKQWVENLYRPGAREEYYLRLEQDDGLNGILFPEGWSTRLRNGRPQAVFAPQGIAGFALQYDAQNDKGVTVSVRKAMGRDVRPAILYGMLTALHRRFVGLHGVTMMCGGCSVILSAPSGTGKTTLSRLLEQYCGGRVINGDFALLMPAGDGVWFEPTPFCGTSGICLQERIRVDHIVFLSQSIDNRWHDLSARQIMVQMMSNAFVPTFDLMFRKDVQENILRMLTYVRVNGYAFAPTEEAARLFWAYLNGETT